jgi:hypothetical protein
MLTFPAGTSGDRNGSARPPAQPVAGGRAVVLVGLVGAALDIEI